MLCSVCVCVCTVCVCVVYVCSVCTVCVYVCSVCSVCVWVHEFRDNLWWFFVQCFIYVWGIHVHSSHTTVQHHLTTSLRSKCCDSVANGTKVALVPRPSAFSSTLSTEYLPVHAYYLTVHALLLQSNTYVTSNSTSFSVTQRQSWVAVTSCLLVWRKISVSLKNAHPTNQLFLEFLERLV